MPNLHDVFKIGKLTGHVKLFNADTDELIDSFDNKVVDNGTYLYSLGLGEIINKMGYGALTYESANETLSGTDALQSADTYYNSVTVKGTDSESITFNFSLSKTEFNGRNIREYGLFYEDSTKTLGEPGHRTLFSRVARTGETQDFFKTSNFAIRGEWKITLSGVGAVPVYR